MKTIVYNINQKSEGPKNGLLVERERERECFYLPVSKTNQGLDLNGFQFITKHGESAVVLQRIFYFGSEKQAWAEY